MKRNQKINNKQHLYIIFAIIITIFVIDGGYYLYYFILDNENYLASPASSYIFIFMICYLMFRVMMFSLEKSFKRRLSIALLTCMIAALIFTIITIVSKMFFPPVMQAPRFSEFVAEFIRSTPGFVVWMLVLLILTYAFDVRDRQRRLELEKELSVEAHLRALRYQLNPHFLYNSLNSISTLLLDQKIGQAEIMVARLATFLRSTLTTEPAAEVPLAHEFAALQAYIDVESVRFEGQIRSHVSLPPLLDSAQIPSLLLLPLVENAIKHGLGPHPAVTDLWLSAKKNGQQLELKVHNVCSDVSLSHPGTSIGLANIQERLERRFGQAHTFEVHCDDRSFEVIVKIPLVV